MRLISNEEVCAISGGVTKLTNMQTTIDAVKESFSDVWNIMTNWVSTSTDSSGGAGNSPIEDLREKINYAKIVSGEANSAGCKANVSFPGDTSSFSVNAGGTVGTTNSASGGGTTSRSSQRPIVIIDCNQ